MKFVQLIEFKTGDFDAFNRTLDEWLAKTSGVRTSSRATQGRDRDNEGTYMNIVEFPVLRRGHGELEGISSALETNSAARGSEAGRRCLGWVGPLGCLGH